MTDDTQTQQTTDWARIELDYRAGLKTLRQIAEENGVTHGAVNKRAKRDGWVRDLSAKIQSKASALVSKSVVSASVSKEARVTERQLVDGNAQAVADVLLAHRRDVRRGRVLVNALLDELEQQTDPATLESLRSLAVLLRREDDAGRDKLNDLYQTIISLPERSKTLKLLTESLGKLVDMERVALNITAEQPPKNEGLAGLATAELLRLRQELLSV